MINGGPNTCSHIGRSLTWKTEINIQYLVNYQKILAADNESEEKLLNFEKNLGKRKNSKITPTEQAGEVEMNVVETQDFNEVVLLN